MGGNTKPTHSNSLTDLLGKTFTAGETGHITTPAARAFTLEENLRKHKTFFINYDRRFKLSPMNRKKPAQPDKTDSSD